MEEVKIVNGLTFKELEKRAFCEGNEDIIAIWKNFECLVDASAHLKRENAALENKIADLKEQLDKDNEYNAEYNAVLSFYREFYKRCWDALGSPHESYTVSPKAGDMMLQKIEALKRTPTPSIFNRVFNIVKSSK